MSTIHAIGYSSGLSCPVGSLATDDVSAVAVSKLLEDGFERIVRSRTDIIDMAGEAIRNCLAASSISASKIDAVVVSTESFWDTDIAAIRHIAVPVHARIREGFADLLYHTIGLPPVPIYTSGLAGCANFTSAVQLAHRLVSARIHQNVLVVLADRARPGESRIAPGGMAAFSDVSVSWIVSSTAGGIAIKHIVAHVSPDLQRSAFSSDARRRSLDLTRALTGLTDEVSAITGHSMRAYQQVVFDNFHSSFIGYLCHFLDVDESAIAVPSKSALGHTFSGDCPLSLACLDAAGAMRKGTSIVLVNAGPWAFGVVVLEAAT